MSLDETMKQQDQSGEVAQPVQPDFDLSVGDDAASQSTATADTLENDEFADFSLDVGGLSEQIPAPAPAEQATQMMPHPDSRVDLGYMPTQILSDRSLASGHELDAQQDIFGETPEFSPGPSLVGTNELKTILAEGSGSRDGFHLGSPHALEEQSLKIHVDQDAFEDHPGRMQETKASDSAAGSQSGLEVGINHADSAAAASGGELFTGVDERNKQDGTSGTQNADSNSLAGGPGATEQSSNLSLGNFVQGAGQTGARATITVSKATSLGVAAHGDGGQSQNQLPGLELGPVRVPPPKQIRGGAGSSFLFTGASFLLAGFQAILKISLVLSICAVALFLLVPFVLSQEQIRLFGARLNLNAHLETLGILTETAETGADSLETVDKELIVTTQPQAADEGKDEDASEFQKFQPTANESYFNAALEALRSGDIVGTALLLQGKPPEPFRKKYDLDMASMVAARFYLFVGNEKLAERVLVDRCPVSARTLVIEICLPLARAYVGTGSFTQASALLRKLSQSPHAENFAAQFAYIQEAIRYGKDATPQAVAAHLAYLFAQNSTDLEWERQQSLWILKNIGLLGLQRWRELARIVFDLRRKDFDSSMNQALLAGKRLKNSAALTRFLEYLAIKYDYVKLPIEHGVKNIPTADRNLALVLQAVSANMKGQTQDFSSALHFLRGKKPYAEIERIMAMNFALQERQISKAQHIMSSQTETIAHSDFGFEWKLGAAHYAADSNNDYMAGKLYEAFAMLDKRNSSHVHSFSYWYTRAKLELFLGLSATLSTKNAEKYILSDRERGLVAALSLEEFARSDNHDKVNVSEVVQKYPWHFKLLSSAILAQGKLGLDPQKYIDMQNRVSYSRLYEGREQDLLTDETLLRLISEI